MLNWRRELGSLAKRGVELVPPVLAEASVAIVVAFRTLDGGDAQGVFKFLKPGIVERLEVELDLLRLVGVHLDEVGRQGDVPQLNYRESFDDIQTKLASELRLDEEQRHLVTARRLYADEPHVQVPGLLPDLCTPQVTAMERVFGVNVTEHGLSSVAAQRRLARTVVRALIARPLLAHGGAAVFHCDPHAGNLMHTTDGRLAILDWSLVTRLSETERMALTRLMLAAIVFDRVRVTELVAQLSVRGTVDSSALDDVVRQWLQRYRQGQFPGVDWLVGLLDAAAVHAGLRVSAEMMLFRKSLLTLEGVLADLSGGEFEADEALAPELMGQFVSELPGRWLASLDSREFATRIANRDLVELAWTWPLAAARCCAPPVQSARACDLPTLR